MDGRRAAAVGTALALSLAVGVGEVAASNVVSGLTESGDVTVPTWLYLATGAGVIGASALLTVLVTDREVLEAYRTGRVGPVGGRALAALGALGGLVGLAALALVVVGGLAGPDRGLVSVAVLLTFVGGRATLPIVAYAVGNPWPALNPWRRLAAVLPTRDRPYPDRLGAWPAVAGLLAFVWLEVVAPLSSAAGALLVVLGGYTVLTCAGAVLFGPATWFRRGDPIAVLFRLYGAVAPLQRTDAGLELCYPGARLTDDDLLTEGSLVAVVLALVWELTYSGFVVTPPGAATVRALVGVGLPPALVYLLVLVGGFGLFWGVYWAAAELTRRRARTYLSRHYVGLRFATPLLAIAAGYHLAHYAGFALSLSPALVATVSAPLSPPPNPTQLALPGWFGYLEIAGILLGHMLAVWVAHVISLECFPGKLQAIRSQAPVVAIMIAFTVVSLYLVSQPAVPAPYAPG